MKSKITKTIIAGAAISAMVLPSLFAMAATNPLVPSTDDLNVSGVVSGVPQDKADLINVIKAIFKWIQYALFIVSSIFIVIGAFDYVTAKGDPDKVKNGQNILIFAVIGLAIGILAGGVPKIVASLLGVTLQ